MSNCIRPAVAAERRRRWLRPLSSAYSGWRSLSQTSSGVATMIEEYAPTAMPTKSASARSLSVSAPKIVAPKNSSEATGRIAVAEVDSDRTRTSLSARLATSP